MKDFDIKLRKKKLSVFLLWTELKKMMSHDYLNIQNLLVCFLFVIQTICCWHTWITSKKFLSVDNLGMFQIVVIIIQIQKIQHYICRKCILTGQLRIELRCLIMLTWTLIIVLYHFRLPRYYKWASRKVCIMSGLPQPAAVCLWSHKGPWPW